MPLDSALFCVFLFVCFVFLCQKLSFLSFLSGPLDLSCLMPMHLAIVFAILVQINIVVSLVDHVELFLTFVNLVIA